MEEAKSAFHFDFPRHKTTMMRMDGEESRIELKAEMGLGRPEWMGV